MKRYLRTICIGCVAVLALGATAYGATGVAADRSASRASVAPAPKRAQLPKYTCKTVKRRTTCTATVMKGGKAQLVTIVKINGKVVSKTTKPKPAKKRAAKKQRR